MGSKRSRVKNRYQHEARIIQPDNPDMLEKYLMALSEKDKRTHVPLPIGLFTNSQLPAFVMDGFSNIMARLGDNSGNIMEATDYHMKRISRDYNLLNTLYRTNWIVRRLIDVVPEDMLKNWYKIESQIDLDAQRKLYRVERSTQIRSKILEGLKWGRLYGGAAGLIVIDGHDDILEEPLSLDMVTPDSFKGIIILDRWSGVTSSLGIVKDYNDPNFGLPELYNVYDETIGTGTNVHHSRIVRFTGRDLPYLERLGEQYWGASELEHVFDELKKRDNTSWNIASLVFRANLDVFKVEGMEQIALMPEMIQRDLYKTLTALNEMKNNQGMQIIGKNDSVESHQYAFSGLSDVYELFMMDISGAAEIPVTKLFGRSPAGMNATGESDMQNYYDSIEEKQESDLRPIFDVLLPIMCMSAFGAVPDDLDYTFVNVRRPSEDEKKNLAQQVANAVIGVYNAGIFTRKMALTELRNASEITGMWQSITDEDIETAEDTVMGGDMPEMPGLLGGEPMSGENDEEPDEVPKTSRLSNRLRKFFKNRGEPGEPENFNQPPVDNGDAGGGKCMDVDIDKPCRAKDPSKCPVHGNGGAVEVEKAYKEAVDKRVITFLEEVDKKDSKVAKLLNIGNLNKTHADKLKELTGKDFNDSDVILTSDAVEHIEKRHGKNGKADHSMSNPEDIARIGYIVKNFDSAELIDKSWNYRNSDNTQADIVLLKKRVNGNYCVAEVATDSKRKSIYIITAYKSKT